MNPSKSREVSVRYLYSTYICSTCLMSPKRVLQAATWPEKSLIDSRNVCLHGRLLNGIPRRDKTWGDVSSPPSQDDDEPPARSFTSVQSRSPTQPMMWYLSSVQSKNLVRAWAVRPSFCGDLAGGSNTTFSTASVSALSIFSANASGCKPSFHIVGPKGRAHVAKCTLLLRCLP